MEKDYKTKQLDAGLETARFKAKGFSDSLSETKKQLASILQARTEKTAESDEASEVTDKEGTK